MLMFALINTFLDDRGDGGSLKVEENDWSVGLTEAGARIIPRWSGPFPQPTGVTVQLIKLEVMLQTLRGCTASAAGGGSHHCLMRCWRCCNGCQTCQAFRAGGMAKGDTLDYAVGQSGDIRSIHQRKRQDTLMHMAASRQRPTPTARCPANHVQHTSLTKPPSPFARQHQHRQHQQAVSPASGNPTAQHSTAQPTFDPPQPLLLSRRAPLPAAALLPALPAAARAPCAFSPPCRPAASLTVRVTVDTPSTNLVLKMTLALLNMPSFRDTTMNWLCGGAKREG